MPYGNHGDYSDDGDFSEDSDHGDGDHENNKVKITKMKMVGSETVKRAIYNLFARATPSSLLFPSLTGAVLAASPDFPS